MLKDKKCNICQVILTVENAWLNRTKGTFQTKCKICLKSVNRKWRSENREQERETKKEYYKKNQERIRYLNEVNRLKRKYNLTIEKLEQMRISQNNLCAICETNPSEVIDHCHTTNKVRSLLCQSCNKCLGCVKDNTNILIRAAQYIEYHKHKEG